MRILDENESEHFPLLSFALLPCQTIISKRLQVARKKNASHSDLDVIPFLLGWKEMIWFLFFVII